MTYTFKNFKIRATYTGSKPATWNNNNYNHHLVTVTNTENGKRTSFDFWASIAHPELESRYDVLNAFYCFVSDAIAGLQSFADFCWEFAYNCDSIRDKRIYKGCRRSAEKLQQIYSGDLYDLANELGELYA